jgi:hypothetical protein
MMGSWLNPKRIWSAATDCWSNRLSSTRLPALDVGSTAIWAFHGLARQRLLALPASAKAGVSDSNLDSHIPRGVGVTLD